MVGGGAGNCADGNRSLPTRDQLDHRLAVARPQQLDRIGAAVHDPLEERSFDPRRSPASPSPSRARRSAAPPAPRTRSPNSSPISRFMRFASAGLAPAVEIAIAIGPVRTIAGRMKLHSGGTSTTLQSIARCSASSNTATFTSVSLVAAIARKCPSRSPRRYGRTVSSMSPGVGQLLHRRVHLGRDHVHARVARQQPLDLLQPDRARPHHQAPSPGQLQAGHVERRGHHVGDAALVAELQAVLAHAWLAPVGLGRHGRIVATGAVHSPTPTRGTASA